MLLLVSRWQHRLVSAVCTLALMAPGILDAALLPSELPRTDISRWQPEEGDVFIADTKENMGYLIHEDGRTTEFRIVTGQRRVVRYIGRVYNAATPERSWTMISRETKGDRTTFGPEGTFLRMKNNRNDEETPYGIHSHRSAEKMLGRDDRFGSMGCIIVSEDVLHIMEQEFAVNNEQLPVLTRYGLQQDILTLRDELVKSLNAEKTVAME